jgi:hypothetical protein
MAVVAVSDYALTLWGARLFRESQGHITIEGSYETVPLFERDINAGRLISVRFLIVLIVMVGIIGIAAKFRQAMEIDDRLYLFLTGFLILIEVPIHVRHMSNIVRYSLLRHPDAAEGKLTYTRWYVLRISSVDFFSFSGLFWLGYAGTGSWFVLGGALRCVLFGAFQLVLSWKAGGRTRNRKRGGIRVGDGVG